MVEKRDIDIILNNPIDWERFRNRTVLVTGATGRLWRYSSLGAAGDVYCGSADKGGH